MKTIVVIVGITILYTGFWIGMLVERYNAKKYEKKYKRTTRNGIARSGSGPVIQMSRHQKELFDKYIEREYKKANDL